MKKKSNLENINDIFSARAPQKKAPSYDWQDLALRVIKELSIPDFKRGAVFKVCKDHGKMAVEQSLNDTKELCKSGIRWKYFFKIISAKETKIQSSK